MNRILITLCAGLALLSACTKTVTNIRTVTDTVVVVDTIPGPPDTVALHINDSLWAWYPVWGDLTDSSGHNHILTLGPGISLSNDVWGNPNGALSFTGTAGSYAAIADGANFNPAAYSISFFAIYLQSSPTGVLFSKVNPADSTGNTFTIGVDPFFGPDTLSFSTSLFGDTTLCTAGQVASADLRMPDTTNFSPFAWCHVVATYANGLMSLYVNNALVGTDSASPPAWCPGAPFLLGNWASPGTTTAFIGKMNEIRIYTRALNPKEVAYLFNNYGYR